MRTASLAMVIAVFATALHALPPLYPEDFGAACNGATDDATALQAWLTAGHNRPLAMHANACVTYAPLVVGNVTPGYAHVSLTGVSEDASKIVYAGPADQPALIFRHVAYFHWQNVQIVRAGGHPKGTTVGIQLDRAVGFGDGTQTLTGTFTHLLVSGFYIGLLAGGDASASEIDCHQCTFAWNDIGWTATNYNSLNFWFSGLQMHHNGVGMKLGGPWVTEAPHILSGASAANTIADFQSENSFGNLSIANFRAEIADGARFLKGAGVPMISVRDSTIQGASPTATVIETGSLHLETSYVLGRIAVVGLSCHPWAAHNVVTIEDSAVTPDPSTGWPVTFPVKDGLYRFRFINNRPSNWGDTRWLADKSGEWNCGVLRRQTTTP